MKKIVFLIIINLFLGCGGEKSFDNGLSINLNNSKVKDDNSNISPKISRALDSIKNDLGDSYTDAYISKDSQNIFVVTKSYYDYTLYNYDISTDNPELESTIFDGLKQVVDIYPLDEKKIIYLISPHPYYVDAMIYDYDKQTMIKEFNFKDLIELDFYIDEEKKELQIDTYTLHYSDMENIYISSD